MNDVEAGGYNDETTTRKVSYNGINRGRFSVNISVFSDATEIFF